MKIIEFSIQNYKIFPEKITFSMNSPKSKNTFTHNKENLLRTSLIFGPNASGKSTLLEALRDFKIMVVSSTENTSKTNLPYKPFLLSQKKQKTTCFEIVFSLRKKIYKYEFSTSKTSITSEHLSEIPASGNEKELIKRTNQKIQLFSKMQSTKVDLAEITRKKYLLLSVASKWNNSLAIQLVDAINSIIVIDSTKSYTYEHKTQDLITSKKFNTKLINYLQQADFNITKINIEEIRKPKIVLELEKLMRPKQEDIEEKAAITLFTHSKDPLADKQDLTFQLPKQKESDGTQSFFAILGPIINSLETGTPLFVDEFDTSLHPYLTAFIIKLFERENVNNAQFVATTHDTTLLSHKNLSRKEHFWFTEKDQYGQGSLYSLAEFKLRHDSKFERKYLEGLFGAVPFIADN